MERGGAGWTGRGLGLSNNANPNLAHFKLMSSESASLERGGAGWTGPGLGLSKYMVIVFRTSNQSL